MSLKYTLTLLAAEAKGNIMKRTDAIQASSRSVPSGVTLSFNMGITQSHPILLTAELPAVSLGFPILLTVLGPFDTSQLLCAPSVWAWPLSLAAMRLGNSGYQLDDPGGALGKFQCRKGPFCSCSCHPSWGPAGHRKSLATFSFQSGPRMAGIG